MRSDNSAFKGYQEEAHHRTNWLRGIRLVASMGLLLQIQTIKINRIPYPSLTYSHHKRRSTKLWPKTHQRSSHSDPFHLESRVRIRETCYHPTHWLYFGISSHQGRTRIRRRVQLCHSPLESATQIYTASKGIHLEIAGYLLSSFGSQLQQQTAKPLLALIMLSLSPIPILFSRTHEEPCRKKECCK